MKGESQPSYAAPSPGPSNNLPEAQGSSKATKVVLWTEIKDSWGKQHHPIGYRSWNTMNNVHSAFKILVFGWCQWFLYSHPSADIGFCQCLCYRRRKKLFLLFVCSIPLHSKQQLLRAGLPSASSAQHLETNTHRASLPSSKGKIWLSLIQLQSTHTVTYTDLYTVGVAQSGLSLACKLLTAQGTFVWGDWHRWNRSRGSSRDLKLCLPLRCL